MKNFSIALVFALTLPTCLIGAFAADQLKSSSIHRGPAIEKSNVPLKKAVLKFLVAANR